MLPNGLRPADAQVRAGAVALGCQYGVMIDASSLSQRRRLIAVTLTAARLLPTQSTINLGIYEPARHCNRTKTGVGT